MKILINILVACMFLVACNSIDSESTTTILVKTSTSTNVDSTAVSTQITTAAPISMSSLPKMIECPTKQITQETGEAFRENIRCVDGWAVGIPQRFVDKFNGDTDVEAEWVMTKRPSGWMVVGVCHIYYPIYSSGSTCNYPYNNDSIVVSLIPPMPVQCVLWDGARFKDSIPETGCPNGN